eukprot:gene32959-40682_t
MSIDLNNNFAIFGSVDDEDEFRGENSVQQFHPDIQSPGMSHNVHFESQSVADSQGGFIWDVRSLAVSDPRWGPSLALRGAFRNAKTRFGAHTDEFYIYWARNNDQFYEDMHSVLRLYNTLVAHHVTDRHAKIRAEVLSFKFHQADEGTIGQPFRSLLAHLGLPLIAIRDDLTPYGPLNGKPVSAFAAPLGPASAGTLRCFMTSTQGAAYVEEANRFERLHGRTPLLQPAEHHYEAPPLSSVGPPTLTPPSICSNAFLEHLNDFRKRSASQVDADSFRQDSVIDLFDRQSSIGDPADLIPTGQGQSKHPRTYGPSVTPVVNHNATLTVMASNRGSWMQPSKPVTPPVPPPPANDEEAMTVQRAVSRANHFDDSVPAIDAAATDLLANFPAIRANTLRKGDLILVPDPNIMTSTLPFNANTALEVPLTTLYVYAVDLATQILTVRVLARELNGLHNPATVWPHTRLITTTLPRQARKASHEMRVRAFQGASVSPATSPPSGAPPPPHSHGGNHGGGHSGSTTAPPADPSPSTSNNRIQLGSGIYHSKTPIAIHDKARSIAWLLVTISPEFLSVATAGRSEFANSYVMDRIVALMFYYWFSKIDLRSIPQHFSHTLDIIRDSVFYVHILNAFPDVAICLYTWQWNTNSCLNTKTSLYLDFFLPAESSQRITTLPLLYTALSCLDKCFYVFHGWQGMLAPILLKLRPEEEMFDKVCCLDYWLSHLYAMFAECTQTTLDTRNHGPGIGEGWNRIRLAEIINKTAALPFTYASNQEFVSEAATRFKGMAPPSFVTAAKAKPTPLSTGGAAPVVTPRPPKTPAAAQQQQPRMGAPRDYAEFKKLGISVPPQPAHTPSHLLCGLDFMAHYKVTFDDGRQPTKCTKAHGIKSAATHGVRLHVHELLAEYTNRYSLAS